MPGEQGPAATALDVLPDAIASRLSPDLATRLARLRPRSPIGVRLRPSHEQVARELGGRLAGEEVVMVEEHLPLPRLHGRARLIPPSHWNRVSGVGRALENGGAPVLLDTETTGLAGGTGTVAFVIGTLSPTACGSALVLRQWVLLAFAGERRMLEALSVALGGVGALVSYNGKPFDVPLLQTRFRMNGLADPFAGHAHLDLLPWVRRTRPAAWPDARLGTVEARWMGVERLDDLPGAEVPAAWRRWLDQGAIRPLAMVLAHNRLDLVSLYGTLQRAVEHEPDDLLRRPAAQARITSPSGGLDQRASSQDSRPWAFNPISRSRISKMRASG